MGTAHIVLEQSEAEELDRAAAWERAAQIMGLPAELMRRVKTPEFESISRYDAGDTPASLFMARMSSSCEGGLVSIELGGDGSARSTADAARALQTIAAVAGLSLATASVHLQIVSGSMQERDIYHLAQQCAPEFAWVVGAKAQLLARDVPSAAFARWISQAAARQNAPLGFPPVSPSEYCDALDELGVDVLMFLSQLGLEETDRRIRGARVTVFGADRIARGCMRKLQAQGARIVAVTDESGAVLDSNELDVAEIVHHSENGGLIAEFQGASHGRVVDALAVPADLVLLGQRGELRPGHARSDGPSRVIVDRFGSYFCHDQAAFVIDTNLVGAATLAAELSERHRTSWKGPTGRWTEQVHRIWEYACRTSRDYKVPLQTAVLIQALQSLASREGSARP